MHEQRLLNVVRALRESPAPQGFTMSFYAHDCGAPACALGHYAARPDLQDAFSVDGLGELYHCGVNTLIADGYGPEAEHFGVTEDEADELFGDEGCGGAFTPDEAADYIMAFIEIKRSAAAPSGELASVAGS